MKKLGQAFFINFFFFFTFTFLPETILIIASLCLIGIIFFNYKLFSVLAIIFPLINLSYSTFYLSGYILLFLIFSKQIQKNKIRANIIYILLSFITMYVYFKNNEKLPNLYELISYVLSIGIFNLCLMFVSFYTDTNNKTCAKVYNEKMIYLIFNSLTFSLCFMLQQKDFLVTALSSIIIINIYKDKKITLPLSFIVVILYYLKLKDINSFYLLVISIILSYGNSIYSAVSLPIIYHLYNNINIYVIVSLSSQMLIILSFYEKKINNSLYPYTNYLNHLMNDFEEYIKELQEIYINKSHEQDLLRCNIEKILNTSCNSCIRQIECSRSKGSWYHFIKTTITKNTPNTIGCPNYNQMKSNLSYEKSLNDIELNSTKNLIKTIRTEQNLCINKLFKYEDFYYFLLSKSIEVVDFSSDAKEDHIICFLKVRNSSQTIIKNYIIKTANSFFKKDLTYSIIQETKNEISFSLHEKNKVKLLYGHCIIPKGGNAISGDNYYVKKTNNGEYIFALSDGMGSGYEAFLESAQILKLISKLTNYHFSFSTILKLIQSAYEIESNFESYATLDLLEVNCVNKKGTLYKMGSNYSYIISNGFIKKLENANLPLELEDLSSIHSFHIKKNDYIILMSDGVQEVLDNDSFEQIILKYSFLKPNELIENIIKSIKNKSNHNYKDDLSIIAIKVV